MHPDATHALIYADVVRDARVQMPPGDGTEKEQRLCGKPRRQCTTPATKRRWSASFSLGKARACMLAGTAQEKVKSAGEELADEGARGREMSVADASRYRAMWARCNFLGSGRPDTLRRERGVEVDDEALLQLHGRIAKYLNGEIRRLLQMFPLVEPKA